MSFYRPLDKAKQEIRLIQIVPATRPQDPLRLQLAHYNLNDDPVPPYLALSYCWDAPGPGIPGSWGDEGRVKISIETRSSLHVPGSWEDAGSTECSDFLVRQNLHLALLNFREIFPTGYRFWVDAICINQRLNAERNHQVGLMSKIYSKCAKTIVWLGPSDQETTTAFIKIAAVANWAPKLLTNTAKLEGSVKEHDMHIAAIRREFGEDENFRQWKLVANIFSRNWWQRAWVLQEAILAPEILVFCGKAMVTWLEVTAVLHLIYSWSEASLHFVKLHESSILRNLDTIYATSAPAVWITNLTGTVGNVIFSKLRLLDVAAILRVAASSEPQDKLYAALGISKNAEQVSPKYGQEDPVDVFKRFAISHINLSKTLGVLGYCTFPPKVPGLPSWVPDWTDRKGRTIPISTKGFSERLATTGCTDDIPQIYSTGGHDPLNVRFEDDGKVLVLRVKAFDMIMFTSTGVSQMQQGGEGMFRWLHEFGEHWDSPSAPTSSYPLLSRNGWRYSAARHTAQFDQPTYRATDESLREVVVNTLSCDMEFDLSTNYRRRWPTHTNTNWTKETRASIHMEKGRIFAVSRMGFFGLVPEETHKGDFIVVVEGGEVPLIVRQYKDFDNRCQLIGECYMHGLMDGSGYGNVVKACEIEDLYLV